MLRKVELLSPSGWIDITRWVHARDPILHGRGRADEASIVEPSTSQLTLDNRDGRFTPSNPLGPYFGWLGLNTQIRVSVGSRARFTHEVSAWPPRWNETGRDAWVTIEAAGIKRRMGQGAPDIGSAYFRHLSGLIESGTNANPRLVAYWPMEDDRQRIGRFGSQVPGVGLGMRTGEPNPQFASFGDFPASKPLPVWAGSQAWAPVAGYSVGSPAEVQFRWLLAIPDDGLEPGTLVMRLRTSGTAHSWQVIQSDSNFWIVRVFNRNGNQVFDSGAVNLTTSGRLVRMSLEARQDGSNVRWWLRRHDLEFDTTQQQNAVISGVRVGRATEVIVGGGATPLEGAAIGHVTVQQAISSPQGFATGTIERTVGVAFKGERAARRITRLFGDEDIPVTIVGSASDTEFVGPQTPDTLLNLAQTAANVDLGIFAEDRADVCYLYRTRANLYNQEPAATLSVSSPQLAEPPEPTFDDQRIRNDITVENEGGGFERAVLNSGPLSIAKPPDGAGRYEDPVTINAVDDDHLRDQATWRLHLGTVEGDRFPQIIIDLDRRAAALGEPLINQLLDLDLGDRIDLADLPDQLPPQVSSQLVQGYSEEIGRFNHRLVFNATPYRPWRVGVWEEDRFDTDGSVLADSFQAGVETSMSVTTEAGENWIRTATHADEFPFDVLVSGVRLRVTAVTGSGATQTFLMQQAPVNGVEKTIPAGEAVRLAEPAVVAL